MNTSEELHKRFNPRFDQIAPVRIKGFTRALLATLFGELGFWCGAEIGVAEGKNSLNFYQHIPNLQLTCVDPWSVYHENPRAHPKEAQEECYRQSRETLEPLGATLKRGKSMDVVRDIHNETLDFVYIDGNHVFDFVMQDLIEWSKKVRSGGIVSGHDYYRFKGAGVVDAVNAYTAAHQIHEWFVDDQRETSFFWAKP